MTRMETNDNHDTPESLRTYFVVRDDQSSACFYVRDGWTPESTEEWVNAGLAVVTSYYPASELAATLLVGMLVGDPSSTGGIASVEEAFYSAGTVVLVDCPPAAAPRGVRPAVVSGTGEDIHALLDPGFAAIRRAVQ